MSQIVELHAPRRSLMIGKSKEYDFRAKQYRLPAQLTQFRNAISWPIPTDTQNIHLACYLNEIDYSGGKKWGKHEGQDIQVPQGTPIFIPEDVQVASCEPPDERNLSNLTVHGKRSGLVYVFAHLDPNSIPAEIRKVFYFEQTNPEIPSGSLIGEVGGWPYQLEEFVQVPEDVAQIYGRDYHHLHLDIRYVPNPVGTIEHYQALMENKFLNPLLLLKKPTD